MSYPRWTYGQYAFPTVSLQDNKVESSSLDKHSSTLFIKLPALRSSLNCTSVPERFVNVGFTFGNNYVNMSSSGAIPPGCPSLGRWSCSDNSGSDGNLRLKPGSFFDCYAQLITPSNRSNDAIPSKCPTTGYVIGRLASYYQVENLSVLHCRPFIEQIDVETYFTLPNYDIDSARPPRAVESTAKSLWDAYPVVSGGSSSFVDIPTEASTNGLHPWVKAIIYGIDGIPVTDLIGYENANRFAYGLDRVLGVMAAQQLNSWARSTPLSDAALNNALYPSHLPSYNATLSSSQRLKLAQNTVSTRLLQSLLGAMVLCAAIAFLKQRTHHVLPKNPCSIAAVGSLLAGSKLLNEVYISPGTEFFTGKELEGILSGFVYSMGWWERDGAMSFGIDVGRYDAKHLSD